MATTETNWTRTGEEYTATPEQRAAILEAVSRLDWRPLSAPIPAFQGLALRTLVATLPGQPVAVAWNGSVENRPLLGIESQYKNGTARSYWLDTGTATTCLLSEFAPA